ncbi:MAG: DUF4363 family protein [Oscillospiraceae bacterium]|nr:DUF4363 family protein [Oscillospiraceae bacterium]
MKRLWVGIGILLILLILGLGVDVGTRALHEPVSEKLQAASQAALQGDWEKATVLADAAGAGWKKNWKMTAALADHCSLDTVDAMFSRLEIYSQRQESIPFATACRELASYIDSITDDHQLKWWNVL